MSRKARKPRKHPRPKRSPARRGWFARLRRGFLLLLVLALPLAAGWGWYLDQRITSHFEGKRWSLPAKVYARPLELYQGLELSAATLEQELRAADYRRGRGPGSFGRDGGYFRVETRGFRFPDGEEPARTLRLRIRGGRIAALEQPGGMLDLARLEPALIGSIYPAHKEDRVLVRLDEVPRPLIGALLVTEDRDFYRHHGLSFSGIARALLANVRAGRVVQGGSTLTQQLIKNFYLSSERTLWRKGNEALMALLLELHYDKDEILEAYLNEVYLGQQGQRAIHGFALASRFYFGRGLEVLPLEQQALLVALVKGPSYYNPRSNPRRAKARRDLVLRMMAEQQLISAEQARIAQGRPLGVVPAIRARENAYPAFMDLVRRHLRRDYRNEDLASEGLRIFTTLAPSVQERAEQAVARRLDAWGKEDLEAAALVVDVDAGEVRAVVGGRDPRYAGFNRALDARRQIGSLIKPAAYLAALERPASYGLGSLIDDEPVQLTDAQGRLWAPQNYDKQFLGPVPLWRALAESRNAATVNLGLELGLRAVVDAFERLGGDPPATVYPSFLLGSVGQTPLEVADMYQTLASGGFRTPLRAVRAVMNRRGELLNRYALSVQRVFDSEAVYLVNHALRGAVSEGTGRGLARWLPASRGVAGKTGTTNDTRDSWFAGYTRDLLGVVWVGRDDNGRTGLTGSSGALTIWGELFAELPLRAPRADTPTGVETLWVENGSGLLAAEHCEGARLLPYYRGLGPAEQAACVGERGRLDRARDWIKGLFE
ncbi:penicillin-binding protein 1B [Alkalilimnicola sp. S0819]|uniref:penicillin-binding protein 1B n=1 Tax=Alkalilimnicola sp. S0819 TaxID=2613922 RepID=UPI001262260D|nr:penicillin-binding protein 1B [Alkalilimnicola sp. S0819]KAB7623619.1 penicillin-binding protein 1B [Alkalilimnicola sp. S0819]MPQ16743.1 penicillin-binding protein 1B [Alkalilimnicola sp. S0819]